MKIAIKPITPVDYGEAAEISNRAYRFMQKYYNREEKKVLGREETEETIRESLQNRIGVVAENEHERVVGFIFWRDYEDIVWIGNLAVDPMYQRNKVAKRLLHYVEDWVKDRNMKAIMLESHKRNQKAHKFYESMNYKRLSEADITNDYEWPFAKPPTEAQIIYGKQF